MQKENDKDGCFQSLQFIFIFIGLMDRLSLSASMFVQAEQTSYQTDSAPTSTATEEQTIVDDDLFSNLIRCIEGAQSFLDDEPPNSESTQWIRSAVAHDYNKTTFEGWARLFGEIKAGETKNLTVSRPQYENNTPDTLSISFETSTISTFEGDYPTQSINMRLLETTTTESDPFVRKYSALTIVRVDKGDTIDFDAYLAV